MALRSLLLQLFAFFDITIHFNTRRSLSPSFSFRPLFCFAELVLAFIVRPRQPSGQVLLERRGGIMTRSVAKSPRVTKASAHSATLILTHSRRAVPRCVYAVMTLHIYRERDTVRLEMPKCRDVSVTLARQDPAR
ncbi:hypothetical protein TNCV_1041451 [Trichonephila clavipes]|nr:hypothetical protein TNCV_1041451 [Trichonephila clavipes]